MGGGYLSELPPPSSLLTGCCRLQQKTRRLGFSLGNLRFWSPLLNNSAVALLAGVEPFFPSPHPTRQTMPQWEYSREELQTRTLSCLGVPTQPAIVVLIHLWPHPPKSVNKGSIRR